MAALGFIDGTEVEDMPSDDHQEKWTDDVQRIVLTSLSAQPERRIVSVANVMARVRRECPGCRRGDDDLAAAILQAALLLGKTPVRFRTQSEPAPRTYRLEGSRASPSLRPR